MRTNFFIVCAITLSLVLGCSDVRNPDDGQVTYEQTIAELSAEISTTMETRGITALSIALIDDQTRVWSQGFGHADVAAGTVATSTTPFRIASVTKLFTAIAVMQLVEAGKIQLDAPVTDYLPELSTLQSRFVDSGPITVRNMLSHHSGLPSEWFSGLNFGDLSMAEYERVLENLPAALADASVSAPPNHIFSYSNVAYELLGVVVARVSDQPYTEYVREHIIAPLGCENSFFDPDTAGIAKGYIDGEEVPIPNDRAIPAGSLFSSVDDLAQLAKMVFANGALNDNKILDQHTLAEMLRPQNAEVALDFGFRQGLGFGLETPSQLAGLQVVGHGGDWAPYHAMMYMMPEVKLGVVVLTNSESGAYAVNDIAVSALVSAYKAKTGSAPAYTVPQPMVAAPDDVDQFADTYASSLGPIQIVVNDQVKLQLLGLPIFDLIPYDDGLWRVDTEDDVFRRIAIQLVREGASKYVVMFLDTYLVSTAQILDPMPVPDLWQERAGVYRISNPQAGEQPVINELHLVYDDKSATLTVLLDLYITAFSWPLAILSADQASVYGVGRYLGDMVHVIIRDGKEHLVYNGYEFVRADQ